MVTILLTLAIPLSFAAGLGTYDHYTKQDPKEYKITSLERQLTVLKHCPMPDSIKGKPYKYLIRVIKEDPSKNYCNWSTSKTVSITQITLE